MKTRRFLSTFVAVVIMLSMISACAAPTAAPAVQPTAAPAAQGKPANWTEASATKSFTYHVSAANATLAKWSATTNNTNNVIGYLIWDPIVNTDETGKAVPWLATSWNFTADYKAITFKLRDDVYFTDGGKMTADDLIFSFEQIRDDKTHYPDSTANTWRQYLGDLVKVNDYEFTINFKIPMPEFWYNVTASNLGVISKAAFTKMGFDAYYQKPVGTGPYVVESWDQPNSTIKLTLRSDKNGYWGYKAANRYTNVKNITIKFSPEAQTRLASLRSKEVQMIDTIAAADKAILDKEGFTTKVMPPVNAVFLQTASAKGDVFDNLKLRQALSLSIDRKLLVDSLLSGYAIPIKWPAMQGIVGYKENPANGYVYDKEKAKQLVKESGYDGKPINFIYTPSTVNIGNELTQAIQSMAAEVGINLKISPLENAVYNDARSQHKYDLCLAAIAVSGTAWIKIGKDVIGADRFNTGFQNTALKDLGKKLGTIMDMTEADKVFKEMWDIEMSEFTPNIYLYWPTIINAWDAKVTGVLLHNNQFPDLSSLVIKD